MFIVCSAFTIFFFFVFFWLAKFSIRWSHFSSNFFWLSPFRAYFFMFCTELLAFAEKCETFLPRLIGCLLSDFFFFFSFFKFCQNIWNLVSIFEGCLFGLGFWKLDRLISASCDFLVYSVPYLITCSQWLSERQKKALLEALEKVKAGKNFAKQLVAMKLWCLSPEPKQFDSSWVFFFFFFQIYGE